MFTSPEEKPTTKPFNYTDLEFDLLADQLYRVKQELKQYEALEKKLTEQLKDLCKNVSYMTESYAFVYIKRIGSVDYSKVPELKGVNLEPYRRAGTFAWTLSKQ